mgnify:FL=1
MAIPILNHLDLRSVSELQNAILHKTTTSSASNVEGKLIYDTSSDTLKFYNGSNWLELGTSGGSVTSVAIAGTDGIDVDSGSPITGAGTITLGLSNIANNKLANSTVSYGGVSLALGATDATPAFDLQDATGYPTSSLTGTITNAQLAGSIANAKLANSSVSYGGVSLSLGGSDATPAFDLADATNYPTSSLSGTITNAQLAGSIANAKLANSSITVDGSAISLGGSVTTLQLGTSSSTALAGDTAVDNVSIANLKTKLAGGFASNAVTIGDSSDVTTTAGNLTVTGNLTVSGDTISANVATLNVEDKNITLNQSSGDSSSTANGAGLTIQDAVDASTDATILWDATNDEFDFSHKITVPSVAGSLILDGNTISGIDDSGEFTNDDNHIMTSAAVEDKILGYGYTTDANVTHRPITAGGNSLANGETLAFTAGSNVTITESGGAVTIASSDTTTNTQLATAAALIDVSAMAGNSTASFTHGLTSKNLIVQLYDTTSGFLVHADVDHTSNTAIAITFAMTGTELVANSIGDIRVVVIDAKNGLVDKTVSYS